MSTTAVGIDIGSFHTKIVCISGEQGTPRLTAFGHLATVGDRDKIKKFIRKAAISSADVRLGFDSETLKIRRLDVPTTNDAELDEAVKWGCLKILDGDVDEYDFRYRKILADELETTGKTPVVVYATKKNSLQNIYSLTEALGLPRPSVIEPNANALSNIFLMTCPPSPNERCALIDLGYETALFTVLSGRGLMFSRPMAGTAEKDLVGQISRNLHVDQQQAQAIKDSTRTGTEWGLPETGANLLKNTIHHFFSRLAIEIQRSLDGYMLALERRKVDRIFLCGGGSQHQGLTNYLTSTLAIPVSLFNPFEKIDTTQFPREQFIKKQALFAVCCGLAID